MSKQENTLGRTLANIVLHPDQASLKRIAWAYGCSKKGSEEERQLHEILAARLQQPLRTFEQAWADKEAQGFNYGQDALENVRFGWKIAMEELQQLQPTERIVADPDALGS